MRTTAAFVATLPNGRVFSDFAADAQDMYNFPINVPFASMAYSHEDDSWNRWFMVGAFLTREEAEADMKSNVANNPNQPYAVWENFSEDYLAFSTVWWPGINEDQVYAHARACRASALLEGSVLRGA
jgi:hypothetical protein